MRIGNVDIQWLSDGTVRLDGGAMFGVVPRVLWKARVKPDRKNRVTIALNCLLVQSGGKRILVDTGAGTKHPPKRRTIFGIQSGRLARDLKARGLEPGDIDMVVLTHLHFDHAGGATRLEGSGRLVPTFPRAQYLVQRGDWEEATQTNERTRNAYYPEDFLPLDEHRQLVLLDGDEEIAPGVWVRRTGGHTRGHQVVQIDSDGGRAVCLGDVVPTPHHLHLPYITAWDLYPLDTLAAKRQFLHQAEKEGWLVLFGHGVGQRSGYLERNGDRLGLRATEVP